MNVDSNITHSNQNIDNKNIDQELIRQLSEYVEQLKQSLLDVPGEHAEEADAVIWAAEELVKEHNSEKPNPHKIVNVWDIGTKLKWDRETTDLVVQYLLGEGLIKYYTRGGEKSEPIMEFEKLKPL